MIVAGVDIGSRMTKAIILDEQRQLVGGDLGFQLNHLANHVLGRANGVAPPEGRLGAPVASIRTAP